MKKYLLFIFIVYCPIYNLLSQQLIPKKEGKLWGYVNELDSFVIKPQYTAVGNFLSGYAWVNVGGKVKYSHCPFGGKWGVIDLSGKIVCPIEYDYVDLCSQDMVAVNVGGVMDMGSQCINGGLWGFVNLLTGKETIPIKYNQVGAFYNEDVVWAQKGGSLVRKIRLEEKKNDKNKIEDVERNFDVFENYRINKLFVHYNASGTWGLVDKNGKELTSFIYNGTGNFHNSVSWVTIDGQYGLIDNTGKELISCQYENLSDCYKENVLWAWTKDNGNNSQIELVDLHGNKLTSDKYSDVRHFTDGVAWAVVNDHFCLVDKTGKELTSPKYVSVGKFWNNIAWVKETENTIGLINTDGVEIASNTYFDAPLLFGLESPFRFNDNKQKNVISWLKHPTLGIIWIDQNGNVIVSKSKQVFSINDIIPEKLWDF